jgi:hypothetical protein
MRVSKSAVQKRTFPDGTASGLDADLKHRAPLGPLAKGDTEPCRVGTWSFSARRWDWSPRSTLTEPPLPADDERRRVSDGATSPAPYPSSVHSRRTAIDAHQAFNSKVASGWSNEGRELLAAWMGIGRHHRAQFDPRTRGTCIEVTGALGGISSAKRLGGIATYLDDIALTSRSAKIYLR